MEEEVYFNSTENIKLCGILTLPKIKSNKIVILVHGFTVDKNEDGIFTRFAKRIAENGFAVFRFDLRGHGESEGKSIDTTIRDELDDLASAINYAEASGFKEIALIGASFGGAITTIYTSHNPHKIKCLCLWNPCLNLENVFLKPYLPWLINDIERIRDELQKKGWTEIGSRKFRVGKKMFDEMEEFFPYEELDVIKIPTLIVHGDEDTYVPYRDSAEYIKRLENGRLVTIHGAEHGFHENPKHEQEANLVTINFLLENFE